jgi:hypothetical protein
LVALLVVPLLLLVAPPALGHRFLLLGLVPLLLVQPLLALPRLMLPLLLLLLLVLLGLQLLVVALRVLGHCGLLWGLI